jgi:hypothetical protein
VCVYIHARAHTHTHTHTQTHDRNHERHLKCVCEFIYDRKRYLKFSIGIGFSTAKNAQDTIESGT